MQWPWVSRRAFELTVEQLERVIKERDVAYEARDRALDQVIFRLGYEPVSAPVRAEAKEAREKQEEFMQQQFDDPGAGMLDESLVDEVAAALVGVPQKDAN